MTSRGLLAWALLVAALAVPGFLFYRWKAGVSSEAQRQLSQKVRVKAPEGGPFASAPAEARLTNPIAEAEASTAAPPAPEGAAAPEAPAPAVVESVPGPLPETPATPAAEPIAASAAAVAASTGAAADLEKPPLPRDPLLSPHDLALLERRRLESLMAREQASRPAARKPKRERRPEQTLELQGIVSGADGRARAIVNGEMVREGDLVGGARVVKITPQSVHFLHKNRKFIKSVSK